MSPCRDWLSGGRFRVGGEAIPSMDGFMKHLTVAFLCLGIS